MIPSCHSISQQRSYHDIHIHGREIFFRLSSLPNGAFDVRDTSCDVLVLRSPQGRSQEPTSNIKMDALSKVIVGTIVD